LLLNVSPDVSPNLLSNVSPDVSPNLLLNAPPVQWISTCTNRPRFLPGYGNRRP
jgi:hypothetical protein